MGSSLSMIPLKSIDIVTLLFLSFLILVIIGLVLHRNIQRYAQRKKKDPHFYSCKNIPKELIQAIKDKHRRTHLPREPSQLCTNSFDRATQVTSKLYLLRAKAYDATRNLENALNECGHKRNEAERFEDFVQRLIDEESNDLPREKLCEFLKYFKWILHDPKVFDIDDWKKYSQFLDKLVNLLLLKHRNEMLKKSD